MATTSNILSSKEMEFFKKSKFQQENPSLSANQKQERNFIEFLSCFWFIRMRTTATTTKKMMAVLNNHHFFVGQQGLEP